MKAYIIQLTAYGKENIEYIFKKWRNDCGRVPWSCHSLSERISADGNFLIKNGLRVGRRYYDGQSLNGYPIPVWNEKDFKYEIQKPT